MLNLEKNRENFKNLRKPDAIIYDWDNTLVDTWPLIKNAINQTLREMNREEWSLEKVRDSVHKSMRESFPEKNRITHPLHLRPSASICRKIRT